jgi:leader peptidase (prepilin peptidase) / N-methyltransferase
MNEIIQVLQLNSAILITTVFIFGLLVGSFLNVVIFRYPIMMFREWESMAKEVLIERGFKLTAPKEAFDKQPAQFNLVVPRSACPQCGHKITSLENLPLISYLVLGGKCRGCKTPISIRYPFVELLTGLAFAACAHYFGFGWPLVFALIITSYFVAMSFIDIDHQILPDTMTLPLLWLALLLSLNATYIPLKDAVIGAAVGYMILWSIYWLFKIVTGKEGMGHGDFKLLAVIGALVGWQEIGIVVLLSAGVGAIIGGSLLVVQKKGSQTKIPFGPYLAVAGWITFLWGDQLLNQYLLFSGLK